MGLENLLLGFQVAVTPFNLFVAVVGIDLLPVDPLPGVILLQMDFMADEAPDQLIGELGQAPDLVMSDMAANTVGHAQNLRQLRRDRKDGNSLGGERIE